MIGNFCYVQFTFCNSELDLLLFDFLTAGICIPGNSQLASYSIPAEYFMIQKIFLIKCPPEPITDVTATATVAKILIFHSALIVNIGARKKMTKKLRLYFCISNISCTPLVIHTMF